MHWYTIHSSVEDNTLLNSTLQGSGAQTDIFQIYAQNGPGTRNGKLPPNSGYLQRKSKDRPLSKLIYDKHKNWHN